MLRPLQRKFIIYHRQNVHVYRILERLALEWHSVRPGMQSIQLLMERARWEIGVSTNGDPYAICNGYAAFYARLLMARCPELRGAFETCRSVADDPPRDAAQQALWDDEAADDGWLSIALRIVDEDDDVGAT